MSEKTFSKLIIADLRLWVHLGWGEEEKLYPQMVSIDIEVIFKNPPKAITTDYLEDTICYAQLVQKVREVCAGGRFNLIERLVGDIHDALPHLFNIGLRCSITKTPSTFSSFLSSTAFVY